MQWVENNQMEANPNQPKSIAIVTKTMDKYSFKQKLEKIQERALRFANILG